MFEAARLRLGGKSEVVLFAVGGGVLYLANGALRHRGAGREASVAWLDRLSERTNWLEHGVVERARELYKQPVSHLVVETPPLVETPRAR